MVRGRARLGLHVPALRSRGDEHRACDRAGVDPSELAAFVPHQANLRIIEAIARKLKADNAVVADDIVEAGNTSAASIPLALSRMIERGDVPSGAPARMPLKSFGNICASFMPSRPPLEHPLK